ncbi:MAG: hypothetical protein V1909_02415 [Candidatus Micrarchaeota archaeon]
MRTLVAIALCLLLFGCQQGVTKPVDGEIEISSGNTECKEISYETAHCVDAGYNFSYSPLKKLDPYVLGDGCVGGASLNIKNLEKQKGVFKVTFTFETPIEGNVTKAVEKEIWPKATLDFEEKAQFRCSQEYSVNFKITPPAKQTCMIVNETREECTIGG